MNSPTIKILIVGAGGREHALTWKLAESPKVEKIFVSPGNGGIENVEKAECVLNLKFCNKYEEIVDFCRQNQISLVVVGPEEHLDKGLADSLSDAGVYCFGPNCKAAKIESSKVFAKDFMQRHGIPSARYQTFTSASSAIEHIRSAPYSAFVVKASGLASGKGVVVAKNFDEACQAVVNALERKIFGDAGLEIVVEELLEGEEISALAFTDGSVVKLMPLTQDHKRLFDNDQGSNTGGMGAYAPCLTDPQLRRFIETEILAKTIEKLKEEGIIFQGVLFAGLMMTKNGIKVLEFNCRFGDPETQAVLPLLKSDLYEILLSCTTGTLSSCEVEWCTKTTVCGVVMASGGYPGEYEKGLEITGLETAQSCENSLVFHAGTKKTDEHRQFFTSGGRVLSVVGLGSNLNEARTKAESVIALIHFKNCHYRRDIGAKAKNLACYSSNAVSNGLTYSSAGVNIEAGDKLVRNIKQFCADTTRPGSSLFDLGGFGGLFDLKEAGYDDPILVSGTDGVGTKLKIAQEVGCHSTIGVDLVAMCVNDILVHNAEPLFFLDYFASGKLNVSTASEVIRGISEGCKQAGCLLIGGETAEMPGFYVSSEYDVAGFAVGAVNRTHPKLPALEKINVGDVVLGVASSGLHSNGFSLVRRVVKDVAHLKYTDECPWNKLSTNLGAELLTPTKIYVKSLLPLLRTGLVKSVAHITGGGLLENIPRVLPKHLSVLLDSYKWPVHEVFKWLSNVGRIDPLEMARTFNCGIGMVLIIASDRVNDVKQKLTDIGEIVHEIGVVRSKAEDCSAAVEILNLERIFPLSYSNVEQKIRVGVLISGTGTNLQALIDYTKDSMKNSRCTIVVVISNVSDVQGLTRAESANIPTSVISHKGKKRETFDDEIDSVLRKFDVELVCLAGFMRILSENFVRKWHGKMINVHPSLLPSFKGAKAHHDVLEAGVRITGCTVHFVEPDVDAGAIILQEPIAVYPNDTIETLSERVKTAEHRIYPRAMEYLARKQAILNDKGKVIWEENVLTQ